jgi:hypothetical protein
MTSAMWARRRYRRRTSAAASVRRFVASYLALYRPTKTLPPSQPTSLRPVGMAPIGPQGLVLKPPVLLRAAPKVPAIVINPLQQGFGGIPGIKEHILGATAQTIARIAEELYGQLVFRRSPFTPQVYTPRDAERAIGPDNRTREKP